MADGTTTPAQAAPAAAPDPLGKGKLPDMFAQYDQTSANIDQIEAGKLQQQKTLEGEREGLGPVPRPPTPQPLPQAQTTSPQQAWASSAMLLAALGSRFTHQPLTTAMNAAAGVLNAYHEGDMAKANVAFQNWKASSDYAMKMYQYELDARKDALGDIDRRERLIESDAVAQEREVMAKYNALDAAFGRTGSFMLGGERNVIAVQKELLEQEQALQKMRDAADKAEVVHEELQALGPAKTELMGTDKYKNADVIGKATMMTGLIHQVAPELAKSNPNMQAADRKLAIQSYKTDYHADPLTGEMPKGAPDFETWYKQAWPSLRDGSAPPTPVPHPAGTHTLPPEAAKHLVKGKTTTFSNGQRWTIGPDGKPEYLGGG